jgi:hypothetical protein
MTVALSIKSNELEYLAAFGRPIFALWGDGKTIFEGIFDIVRPYGATLRDFGWEPGASAPSDQVVSVTIGSGQLRFRFDRIEYKLSNFADEQVDQVVSILASLRSWLDGLDPEFTIESHLIAYSAHGGIENDQSEKIFRPLVRPELASFGENLGGGLIHNGWLSGSKRRFKFTLDQSLLVEGGVYFSLAVQFPEDRLEYSSAHSQIIDLIDRSLTGFSLKRQG